MAILITGGAGFIGSYVNKLMTEKGYLCVILDDLSRGQKDSALKSPFFKGDIADTSLVKKIVTDFNVKAVMHFAAFTNVKESVDHPEKYYLNNVSKTLTLLTTLKNLAVKKFVFSSSAAVYGIPCKDTIDENHPLSPINPYGESKLMCERILKDFDRAYDFKSVSLRYFNVAGGDPEGILKMHHGNQSNLIPKALISLIDQYSISVFGTDWPTKDGSGIRDYIHIHDIATAHILALEQLLEGGNSKIYNLGNGNGYSVLEVLSAIEHVTKKKLQIDIAARREGDPPILVANAEKAQAELGWKPDYGTINKMIEDAWFSIRS